MSAQYHKYPDEVRLIVFDYSPMTTHYGVTLTGTATVATIAPPDTALTIGTVTRSVSTVSALVSAGTAGQTYVIGCSVGTSDGQTVRINGSIIVRQPGETP
jgi:hypothetical protein